MGTVKSVLHWMRAKIRGLGAFASGEDLTDAQTHRGDNHERRSTRQARAPDFVWKKGTEAFRLGRVIARPKLFGWRNGTASSGG